MRGRRNQRAPQERSVGAQRRSESDEEHSVVRVGAPSSAARTRERCLASDLPIPASITIFPLTKRGRPVLEQDGGLVKGTLDVLILKAVSWGPRHGYAVAEWINLVTEAALLVEEGPLYTALHRLEKKGW